MKCDTGYETTGAAQRLGQDGTDRFRARLVDLGFELISTAERRHDRGGGLPVLNISDVTGFPEMLEGRVKTLHPAVHGGLLADRSKPEHMEAIAAHAIQPIDLVCVNLYPFAATVAKPNVALEDAIENIDIGGPAMIRSAAKNHTGVLVVVSASDYEEVLKELRDGDGEVGIQTRRRLAAKAYAHTGQYDAYISRWLADRFSADGDAELAFPKEIAFGFHKAQDCRYGENPHQKAAFYVSPGVTEPCVANAKQLHGKELSFNNFYDLNGALETVKEFSEEAQAAAVVIKHSNPCGVGLADTLAEAFLKARLGDPIECLRAIGTDGAMMRLNGIAQKLPFKGLKAKAAEMMEAIARDRKMTRARARRPDRARLRPRRARVPASSTSGPRQFSFVLGSRDEADGFATPRGRSSLTCPSQVREGRSKLSARRRSMPGS